MLNRDCRELTEDLLVILNRRLCSLIVSVEADNLFVPPNISSFFTKTDSKRISFLEADSSKSSSVSSRKREPSSGRSIKYNSKRATRTSVYCI
ncbi:unnamed protein product [Brugia timori]|uniref:Uncharacterized protein n=1 Tax=Brugia timori TaxID=42155 RepID=A0A0R3QBK0_9BILA|nr:unnamed protein product [Brugia timori]